MNKVTINKTSIFIFAFISVLAILFMFAGKANAAPSFAGTKTVAVMPIYFGSPGELKIRSADLKKTFSSGSNKYSLRTYMRKITGNALNLAPVVLPAQQIHAPMNVCNTNSWMAESKALANSVGGKNFDYYFFYFNNSVQGCSYDGATMMYDHSMVFINFNNPKVIIHEFGHVLGLAHAGAANCAVDKLGYSLDNCPTSEYGNSFDVMGATYDLPEIVFNNYNRLRLGLLSSGNITVANLSDHVYTIKNSTTQKRGKLTLQIPKQGEVGDIYHQNYWVDYRSFPHWGQGILLNIGSDPFGGVPLTDTTLVVNPLTKTNCWRSMPFVKTGEVAVDYTNNLLIGVEKTTNNYARVHVKRLPVGVAPSSFVKRVGKKCVIK